MKIRKSKKARRLRITVKYTGEVIVTVPAFVSIASAEKFIQEKAEWIKQSQEKARGYFTDKIVLKQTQKDFQEHKAKTLAFVHARLAYFNTHYRFSYKRVSVKNQISRWGSCSSRGNLNFNYGIIYLPEHLANYIIVHELCHLREMNHGKKFWALVAETIPDYREHQKELASRYVQIS